MLKSRSINYAKLTSLKTVMNYTESFQNERVEVVEVITRRVPILINGGPNSNRQANRCT